MKVSKLQIGINSLIHAHRDEVVYMSEDSEPLSPDDVKYAPIVRPASKGGYAIVDGFSRISGMVADSGEDVEFLVIVVEDAADLIRDIDCDSVIGECEELDLIYAAADEIEE